MLVEVAWRAVPSLYREGWVMYMDSRLQMSAQPAGAMVVFLIQQIHPVTSAYL